MVNHAQPRKFETKDANGGAQPSLVEINEKVGALGSAWEQFKQKNDERLKEMEKKGSADPLHTAALEKMNAFMDETKAQMDKLQNAASRPGAGASGEEVKAKEGEVEYKNAYCSFLRGDIEYDELKKISKKTMSVGSDPDGGYLVLPQLSQQIITVQNESSPMRQLATVETINTDSLDVLEDRGTVTATWSGEQDSVSSGTTPTFGMKNIPAREIRFQFPMTQQIIDDASRDVEGWAAGKIAEGFSLAENTAFISGNGIARPRGILGYTPASTLAWGNPLYVASGTSGVVEPDGLINTVYSLKERYTARASWLMRRATEGNVRTKKDGQGRYLWEPSLQAGKPNMLLGYPVYQAADMEAIGSSAYAIAFGDWKTAYTIVDRIGVRLLRDPYTSKPNVLLYATKRVGGDVTNFEAFVLNKLATS